MAFKFVVLAAALAVANAGYIGAPAYAAGPAPALSYSAAPAVSHVSYASPVVSYGAPLAAHTPAITSQSANILRSYGNLGQISTYSKTIDTPFSSVSKSDVRVSNPGLKIAAAAPLAYAAPALHHTYAAPAVHASYAAPALHTTYAAPAVHTSYAAPAVHTSYAAPALHTTYAAPAVHASYAAPAVHASYAAPAVHAGYAAPAAIGVAYSAAPAVSHVSYQGLGASYGW